MANPGSFRSTVARWLGVISIALLVYCIVALIIAWGLARRDGWIPQHWLEADGNHGPWRRFHAGRTLVEHALMAPFGALVLGGLAYVSRPATRIAVLLVVSLLTFLIVACTHFWLID